MRPDRENRPTEHAARWWLAVLVLATFEALLGNYTFDSLGSCGLRRSGYYVRAGRR